MYIEFLGLPGSGKSTIQKQALDKLQADSSRMYFSAEEAFYRASLRNIDNIYKRPLSLLPAGIGEKFAAKLIKRTYMQSDAENRFLAKHGKALSAFFASDIYAQMKEEDRSLVIGSFMEAGSIRECVKDIAAKGTVIFEEGLVQKSLMFVDHQTTTNPDTKNITDYLLNIPKPDLLVFIEVNIDDCHQRMLSRTDGLTTRLKKADAKTILSFLQRINSHLYEVSDWLKKNHHPIVHIENNNDPMEAVNTAFESIRKLNSA